eukprot:COSAG01_NODE_1377_length_10527_cov_806.883679_3_plen_70_part_00
MMTMRGGAQVTAAAVRPFNLGDYLWGEWAQPATSRGLPPAAPAPAPAAAGMIGVGHKPSAFSEGAPLFC